MIPAFGFILMFISNQVTLVASSFPPYGTATISYFGLSSYLILIGLNATALSLSQDLALRKSIRKSLLDKSNLLGGIGSAEMQIETEKWVRNIDKRDIRTDIPPSMTEDRCENIHKRHSRRDQIKASIDKVVIPVVP